MRIVSTIKRYARRGLLLTALTGTIIGGGVFIGSLIQNNGANAATTCSGFNGDSNAVIWCGADDNGTAKASEITARYNNGDGYNSAASIHNIYGSQWFNISSADVQNLSQNAQLGSVTKSGNVMIGSNVVANNALTAGRQNIAGSTQRNSNGTIFYTRAPSVSFLDNSLPAYVVMSNGQFKFAILLSCGNPVSGKPTTPPTPPPTPKTPDYTINKEVAAKGSTNYQKSITVQSGAQVDYRITVDSTGTAPVTNLDVNDSLPQNVQYVAGSLKEDGQAADATSFFANGVKVGTLNPGASTVFTFEAVIGDKDTIDTCAAQTLNNEGDMTATSLPGKNSTATVNKTCAPKPVFACTSLTSFQVSDSEFKFTAQATAKNGATITGYTFDFGDGSSQPLTTAAETATAQHAYAAPGTYNTAVSVTIAVEGTTQTVTAPACTAKVTVVPPPAAECTDLELTQAVGNPRQVTATAKFTASNGATLTAASFDWGDQTTPTAGTAVTANHTYQQDGTYTVKATLTFSAQSGTVPPSNCQAMITVTTVPPVCNNLTVDVNNDTKQVTVTGLTFMANNGSYEFTDLNWGDSSAPISDSDITGQQHTYSGNGPFTIVATPHFLVNGVDTAVNANTCQQTVSFTETPPATPPQTPPTQLVNTGAGSVMGLFTLSVIGGIFGYRRLLSRRLGRTEA